MQSSKRSVLIPVAAVVLMAGCGGASSPWTAESRAVDVTCWGYFNGPMEFRAERAQLSDAQLNALAAMTTVASADSASEDALACQLAITGGDGKIGKWDAVEGHAQASGSQIVIDYASFKPLLDLLGCQFGKDEVTSTRSDVRCFDGLFTTGQQPLTRSLTVADSGTRHIEIDDCSQPGRAGKLEMKLYDASGTTLVAEGAAPADPGPDQTCMQLTTSLSGPASYQLELTFADGFTAGDMLLHYESAVP